MVQARAVVLFQEDEHVGSGLEKGGWNVERHLGTHGRPVAEDGGQDLHWLLVTDGGLPVAAHIEAVEEGDTLVPAREVQEGVKWLRHA